MHKTPHWYFIYIAWLGVDGLEGRVGRARPGRLGRRADGALEEPLRLGDPERRADVDLAEAEPQERLGALVASELGVGHVLMQPARGHHEAVDRGVGDICRLQRR